MWWKVCVIPRLVAHSNLCLEWCCKSQARVINAVVKSSPTSLGGCSLSWHTVRGGVVGSSWLKRQFPTVGGGFGQAHKISVANHTTENNKLLTRSELEPKPNAGPRSRSELLRITGKFGVRVRQNLPEPDANRTSRTLGGTEDISGSPQSPPQKKRGCLPVIREHRSSPR